MCPADWGLLCEAAVFSALSQYAGLEEVLGTGVLSDPQQCKSHKCCPCTAVSISRDGVSVPASKVTDCLPEPGASHNSFLGLLPGAAPLLQSSVQGYRLAQSERPLTVSQGMKIHPSVFNMKLNHLYEAKPTTLLVSALAVSGAAVMVSGRNCPPGLFGVRETD